MPCKRLQPSYRPSANLLTLVPTRTTEYIAAGDSQAAVPLPTEILYIIQVHPLIRFLLWSRVDEKSADLHKASTKPGTKQR